MPYLHFTHPALLYLASAAVIPVIIHLLRRRRLQVVRFPAVRYLRASTRKRLVRINLKRLLLLALRMLLIALMAVVLARPLMGKGARAASGAPTAGTEPGEPVSAVFILDDSLSMNYRRGEACRFDEARNAALDILGRLPPGAEVAITTTSRPVFRFTRDGAELRAALARLQPTLRANTCLAALRRAAGALASRPSPAKVIYLLTDMTRSAWTGLPGTGASAASGAALDLGKAVALEIIALGEPDAANVAVTALSHEGEPILQGAMLKLRTRLLAVGSDAERLVEFEFDGRPVVRRRVRVAAGGTQEVRFEVPVEAAGHHWGRVSLLEPDALPQDDSRCFTLSAPAALSVLCVDETLGPGESRLASRSYFFAAALNPWNGSQRGGFRVESVRPEGLEKVELSRFDLVALVDTPGLREAAWQRLADFVAGGGALLVSVGEGTDPRDYLVPVAQQLRPAIPAEVVSAPPSEHGALRIRAVAIRHPLVRALSEAGADLSRARFLYCRRLRLAETAEEVFSFGPGLPALVLGYAGGRVAVFAGGLSTEWTDLPRRPEYVPFCHELAYYLTGLTGGRLSSFKVGDQVPIRFEPSSWPTAVSVVPPGSSSRVPVLPGATPGRRLFWRTERAGYYTVEFSRRDRRWQGGFAVNTDPAESDLRRMPTAAVQAAIRAARVRVRTKPSAAQVPAATGRGHPPGSTELTGYLVMAGLLALLAEALLANRIYGAPPEPPAPEAPPTAESRAKGST